MAQANKTTRTHLIRTEDTGDSIVRFFDRRTGEHIAMVDTAQLSEAALQRAARHGVTQNLLDSSNKLEGDARVAFIRAQAAIVQSGGWAEAPSQVDPVEAMAKLILKMGAADTMEAAMEKARTLASR